MGVVVVALCVSVWSKCWSSNVNQACVVLKIIIIMHFVYNACSVLVQLDVSFHWGQISFFFVSSLSLQRVCVVLHWMEPEPCAADYRIINGVVTENYSRLLPVHQSPSQFHLLTMVRRVNSSQLWFLVNSRELTRIWLCYCAYLSCMLTSVQWFPIGAVWYLMPWCVFTSIGSMTATDFVHSCFKCLPWWLSGKRAVICGAYDGY